MPLGRCLRPITALEYSHIYERCGGSGVESTTPSRTPTAHQLAPSTSRHLSLLAALVAPLARAGSSGNYSAAEGGSVGGDEAEEEQEHVSGLSARTAEVSTFTCVCLSSEEWATVADSQSLK